MEQIFQAANSDSAVDAFELVAAAYATDDDKPLARCTSAPRARGSRGAARNYLPLLNPNSALQEAK